MLQRHLLYTQLVVVAILAVLHVTGIQYDLYWQFLWLDLVSHTLGGLWVGFFLSSLWIFFGRLPKIVWVTIGALLLGIGWEFFEVAAGIPREGNYMFDTSLDLLADVIGSIIAVFFVYALVKMHSVRGK